ncbi:L-lactate permease [Anatilimnocola aggregata]|uniref:L-lactate permease n=1 Tax=Anatilimnocola aggregata TaxID=2528021 RepID=A0A517YGB9_9BACT|nr:L-lactate permease [Anatilimnocola aggregata]QDU29270.1 L-lactate permease [Anatilimnocola aggregata]
MTAADLIFAAGPVLLLIYWMTKRAPIPSAKALPLAAIMAYGVRLVWFGTDANLVNASVMAGLLVALTPIFIVWGAIFLFRTMEHCGAMDTIRHWLNHLSRNRVAQVVIIGWSFQFLIEGASGFGTPAALAAPLLVGVGFPPLRVAMACLILNSVPVSFGAVGTPTWFGFAQLGLTEEEFLAVAWKTALVHSAAACVVPLLAFRLLISWQEIWRNLIFIYLALAASVVPMFLLALVDDEFPAVAGGLIGLLVTVWLARHRVGLAREDEGEETSGATPTTRAVVKALFPLWATVLVLLATRIPAFGLRGLLTAAVPGWDFPLGSLGSLSISQSLVLSLRGIFGTDTDWTHQILYVPSLIPFILVSIVSWRVLSAPAGTARSVWQESAAQMRNPILALLGALVFVRLLTVGGDKSSVILIGSSLAAATGDCWQYLAAYLGALGAFFAGSCTISNLTFGPIQDSIATRMGLDHTTILALQSVGGAMGNMIAIHNIVAVCSVLGLVNQEGEILKRTVGPMLLYGAIAAALAVIL